MPNAKTLPDKVCWTLRIMKNKSLFFFKKIIIFNQKLDYSMHLFGCVGSWLQCWGSSLCLVLCRLQTTRAQLLTADRFSCPGMQDLSSKNRDQTIFLHCKVDS